MSENSTKGPWSVATRDGGEVCGIDGPGHQRVLYGCGCCGSPDLGANDAKLIAAAPELYAAALAAIAYDEAIEQSANDPAAMSSFCTATGDRLDDLYADWMTKARTALSKARGEQT